MITGARNRFSGSAYSAATSPTLIETNRSNSPTLSSSHSALRMSGKDRTSEFMSAVQMLHSPQVSREEENLILVVHRLEGRPTIII